jgi:hypothetical protein
MPCSLVSRGVDSMSSLQSQIRFMRNIIFGSIILLAFVLGPSLSAYGWEFGGMDRPKTSIEYSVGMAPRDVVVGDITGDGMPEIITADYSSDSITILFNDGHSGFSPTNARSIEVGAEPTSLALSDVDGGHLDIVVANSGDNTVTVLLGTGTGNFTEEDGSPYDVGPEPQHVVIADIDGAHPDIITANTNSDTITVLPGMGDGSFDAGSTRTITVGEEPWRVLVTDVNGGDPDIVVSNYGDSSVTVLLGTGGGSFDEADGSPMDLPGGTLDIRSADLDGDGSVDLVVAYEWEEIITVLYGDGSGGFSEGGNSPLAIAGGPISLAIEDANEDGTLDIIAAESRDNSVRIFAGDGNRSFRETINSPIPVGRGPSAIGFGDLDDDGHSDLVTVNEFGNDVSVLLGHGHGEYFSAHLSRLNLFDLGSDGTKFSSKGSPMDVHIAGPDADGFRYILTANQAWGDISVFAIGPDGTIPLTPTERLGPGTDPSAVTTSAINGGLLQIIVSDESEDEVRVFRGTGNGAFGEAESYTVHEDPSDVVSIDINGDGIADIITAHELHDRVEILLGKGDGTFQSAENGSYIVGDEPRSLMVMDLDGNKKPDIVTANYASKNISVLLGDGTGNFTERPGGAIGTESGPVNLQISDVNNDGDQDILVALWDSDHIEVILGDGAGGFMIAPTSPVSVGDGPWKLRVRDLNGDGNQDIVTANSMGDDLSILLGDGTGSFAPVRFSPLVTGIEPLGLSIANVTGNDLPDIVVVNGGNSDNIHIYETIIDYDGDGVPDEFDELPTNPTEWKDFDHDLLGNNSDPDDDNDGFPDMIDVFPLNRLEWNDTDGDGVGDNTDEDIDGDDVDNIFDLFPYDRFEQNDTDMDGIGDNSDPDIDDDGHINIQDLFPFDRLDWADFDGDGIGDNTDGDIDNDTYLNPVDAFDYDHREWNDTDGDGDGDNHDLDIDNDLFLNIFDEFPFLATEWADLDGDGVGDNTDPDRDGDTVANVDDVFPDDPTESADLDGDHIGDNVDPDIDGDNVTNLADAFPVDGTEWSDFDRDGIGDNTDPERDGDGVSNAEDVFPDDPTESADLDGDHIGDNADPDVDGDNVENDVDGFPRDGTEWSDLDGDGIGDNADTDKDGDGHPDDDDAYPWDRDRWEEEEEFLGWNLNIGQYNAWLIRLLFSTLLLAFYSVGSTVAFFAANRYFFISGLYWVKRSQKVDHYKKEIGKTRSIRQLNGVFSRVESDLDKKRLSEKQYTSIREEAEKRRVGLTYSILASLTPDQQYRIFNDILQKGGKATPDPMEADREGKLGSETGEGSEMEDAARGGKEGTAPNTGGTSLGAVGILAEGKKAESKLGEGKQAEGKLAVKSTADISDKNIDKVHFTVTSPPRVIPKSTFVVDL